MRNGAGGALAVALLAVAAPAHAQSQEIVRDMAGPYQIVPTDGSPVCGIQLTAEPVGQAWRARPDPTCAARVRASAGVVAWRPVDGILLLDARGKPAMTFVEDETALPSSPDLQSPKHYLVPRIAGYTHLPQPSELVGKWTLKGRGRAPCSLSLTATPASSSAPRRGIVFGAGCTGAPLPRKLTRWSMEDMKIMLWGANDEMLSLEPVADNSYVSEPGAWSLSR